MPPETIAKTLMTSLPSSASCDIIWRAEVDRIFFQHGEGKKSQAFLKEQKSEAPSACQTC